MPLERRGRPRSTWTWAGKFGSFVSSYRVELLADEVGVDPTSVYRYLRGDSAPPITTALAIVRVARDFGTPLTLEDVYFQQAVAGDRTKSAHPGLG